MRHRISCGILGLCGEKLVSSVDNTHTNIWGGRVNAYLCLNEIKKLAVPGLSEHVLDVEFPSEDYLESNPEYIPVVFDANLKDSVYWKPYEQWKGTVFGDIPPGGDFSHFTLEPVENGVHIAVRDNAGKISAVTTLPKTSF